MQEIEIVPVREMSDIEAKVEILRYVSEINRKPYISEVVDELHLDIEQVKRILKSWGYPWELKNGNM